jgi:hypothetical protein
MSRFEMNLEEVTITRAEEFTKHGTGDQKPHGSWATGVTSLDPVVASSILERVRDNGGLSVNMVDGSEPTSGYMVAKGSQYGSIASESDFYDAIKGPKILADYMKKNKSDLGTGKNYLGLWHNKDDGQVYLDISENIQDRDRARSLGLKRDQISIWDVANFSEIETGGTGNVGKDRSSQTARHLEDDGRRDRRLRPATLDEVGKTYQVIKFEAGLRPVFKHGEGDQKPHGSWANGSSNQSKLIDKMQDLGPTQDDLNSYLASDDPYLATLDELDFMVRNNPDLYDVAIYGIDETVDRIMSDFGFDNPLTRSPEEIEEQRLIEFEQQQEQMISDYLLNETDRLQELYNIENNKSPLSQEEAQEQLMSSFTDVYNMEHKGVDSNGIAKTLTSRVNEVYLADGDIMVQGDVSDEERDYGGEFARRFFKGTNPDTGKETWNVEHVLFKLESEGTGFGKEFITQQEAYYTSKGMGYITVGTEWDGARHWARAGYDFDPAKMKTNTEQLLTMRTQIEKGLGMYDLIQTGTLSQNYKAEALAEFDSLMKRTVTDYKVPLGSRATFNTTKDFKSNDFPIPADFANIGYTKGAKTWAGKEAMYGLNMKYVKVLTAEGQNLLDAPIDRDGDGKIFDGTARERPAPTNN